MNGVCRIVGGTAHEGGGVLGIDENAGGGEVGGGCCGGEGVGSCEIGLEAVQLDEELELVEAEGLKGERGKGGGLEGRGGRYNKIWGSEGGRRSKCGGRR